jgi:transposase-like protein
MTLDSEFLKHCTPVELQMLSIHVNKEIEKKVTPETTNYENLVDTVCQCPRCHGVHYKKNGFNPGLRQKYRCKDCGAVFMATTGTMFSHSRSTYSQWSSFIAGELNGLTLEQEVVAIERSKTTCFNMRHKLYEAAGKKLADKLHGLIQMDAVYTKINLKGTRSEKMPRISKTRGKHKTSTVSKNLAGLSHHKVCIVSAIDGDDNILMRISGLGNESAEKYEPFANHFLSGSTIISDSSSAIRNFAQRHQMISEQIPVIAEQQHYTTSNGNSVAECNELHTELKNMLRKKHGVSIRHLQFYMDWLVFGKQLKYAIEARRRKLNAYTKVMAETATHKTREICSLELPISLLDAYGEYHYGILRDSGTQQLFA